MRKTIAPARFGRRSRLVGWVAALMVVVVLLGFGNWFAHQTSARRADFGSLEPLLETLGIVTADVTDALGLTGRDVSVPYVIPVPKGPLPFGEPHVVDASKAPSDIRVLKRKGYWVGYSPSLGYPVWVAYAVPAEKLLQFPPARPPFSQDRQEPGSPRPEAYTGSGYDRGHMAPNYVIATRYGRAAQRETFLMTNIAPQKPELNRGPWRRLEQTVADDLSGIGDTVWVIVCTVPKEKAHRLRKSSVRIPKGFCMIIAAVHEKNLRALGVYMPQEISASKRPRYCFRSVRELETLTGLDFFPVLSKDRQAALEVPEANRFWPSWELF